MEENSKCILCRKLVPKSKTKLHSTNRKMGIQQQTLLSWRKECAVTLCEVMLGKTVKPFYQYFRTGEFCSSCLDAVRDINFTWKQVKSLETRMNRLSVVIQRSLKTNYGYIEQKTKEEVVEERMAVAYNSNDTEDVNFLDGYSYDEITEILHAAMSNHSFSAIFRPIAIKKELPSFSGDDGEEMFPVGVKLELDPEECHENSGTSDDDYADVTKSHSEYLSGEKADPTGGSEMQTIKRKRVTRARVFKNPEVVFDDEVTSSDTSNDEEYANLDHSDGSECDSEDSWSPKLSRKESPAKKLSLMLEDAVKQQKTLRSSAKSKRKTGRPRKNGRQPRVKLECPTCHRMITRHNFLSHKRTHTGEKPLICSECGKTFNAEGQLWRHSQMMHAKLNPNGKLIKNPSIAVKAANELASRGRVYHCEMCSWRFTWKYRYLRHLKDTHLNKDIKDGDSFNFHYCDEDGCSVSFTSLSSLRTHISEVHSPADKEIPILECKTCQRIFSQQSSLDSHIKSHEDGNFGCDYCCLTFPTRIEMDEHLPRHTIVFQLSMYCHLCEECGERFSDVNQLRKHIANLHTNTTIEVRRKNVFKTDENQKKTFQKFFCTICQKAIYKGTPEGHRYSHTHPDGFQCSKCPEIFTTPSLLEFHLRRLHTICRNPPQSKAVVPSKRSTVGTSENKTICHVCQQEVFTNSFEIHLQSHFHPNGFQCLKCPAIELSPELLQIHGELAHPSPKQPKLQDGISMECHGRKIKCQICQKLVLKKAWENHTYSHTNPNGFQCSHPNCTVMKRTPNLIKYHESIAHKKDNSHLPAKSKKETTPKKCEFCGNTYMYKIGLRKHLFRHHPEEYQATRPFTCRHCWNVFASEEEKKVHIEKMHRSIICSFEGCGRRFPNRVKLTAHLNVHYNRKPYECSYCSKGFANDGNCRAHILMVHTKHRSVRCKLCPDDIGYYVKKEFFKHVQIIHPEIPESEYTSILERKRPDVPVKIIHNKMLQASTEYPAKN